MHPLRVIPATPPLPLFRCILLVYSQPLNTNGGPPVTRDTQSSYWHASITLLHGWMVTIPMAYRVTPPKRSKGRRNVLLGSGIVPRVFTLFATSYTPPPPSLPPVQLAYPTTSLFKPLNAPITSARPSPPLQVHPSNIPLVWNFEGEGVPIGCYLG